MLKWRAMPSYLCKIGTADGRVVEKLFESATREQLQENLEAQGFYVFHIRRQLFRFLHGGEPKATRPSGRRFLAFNQELLVLLRSGLPILQILDTQLGQMEMGAFREVLAEVREEIRSGTALSDAFAKYPRFFPPLYVASVRAGEKTGDLPLTLTRFLEYQKRVEAIRSKIRSASFYPLLLVTAAVAVVCFLMLFVLPRFTEIYTNAHVELPLMTRILIGTSALMVEYWPLLLLAAVGLVVVLKLALSSSQGRHRADRLLLQIPFFGALLLEYALSGFCRTLGTVLASGTPLVVAMQMSRGTLNNRSLEREMVMAIRRVEEGTALSEALERTGFFPALALRMIGVGETSGSLTEMLGDISDYYEAEVEQRLNRLTTMIEPLLMVVMGSLIAFIIVAMYMPIFQLAGTVS